MTYPPLVGFVTVTFNTTAETPAAGTPPAPPTCRPNVACAATFAFAAPTPARVSNTRVGDNDTNAPGSATVIDAPVEAEGNRRDSATVPPAVATATGLPATNSAPTATPSTYRKLRAPATVRPLTVGGRQETPEGYSRAPSREEVVARGNGAVRPLCKWAILGSNQ